ncbi:LysR family transcriptional regulator [Erwinia typographi]|uniref:LysR family transcriptional regulator n=1 Tax=Erwinia typographi TaxID=371042 RepID=A0A0A4A9Z3_9GAMM|nr:LysR family transcriptional regulator [Erwinia typographi]KGT94653.1 LysR family transcriptional regulator [Erwinia typographi]
MAHFTLRQLKYFITVVEHRSIAEASRHLHIAQPSISTAIKSLEESFEQQLFIRHHAQGVSLTPGGRRFYDKAAELLRMSRQFEQNARADNDLVAGTLSVGCFETAAPLYMPKLIAGFKKLYPNIEVQIYDGEQHELTDGLHRGRFDMAILYRHELDSSIHAEQLKAPQKPYALLPADHPLTLRSSVSLEELSREPMILLDVVPSRNYFLDIFKTKGLKPNVAFSSPSIEMVRCMVGQGFGFSLLVTRPFPDFTYDGKRVKRVTIRDEMEGSCLVMAHLRHAEPTRPTQLFMDYCRSQELTPEHLSEAEIHPLSVA